jgi:hypothetical protein
MLPLAAVPFQFKPLQVALWRRRIERSFGAGDARATTRRLERGYHRGRVFVMAGAQNALGHGQPLRALIRHLLCWLLLLLLLLPPAPLLLQHLSSCCCSSGGTAAAAAAGAFGVCVLVVHNYYQWFF